MTEPHLDVCAFCDVPTWCRQSRQGPMCGACRVVRFFRNVLFAPIGFTLLPWQEKVLRGLYGPVDPETGHRKIRRALVSVAKKQGKSFLVGGIPLYHLTMEDVDHPEGATGSASIGRTGCLRRPPS